MTAPRLYWLPEAGEFRAGLAALRRLGPEAAWRHAVALARHDLDFVQTNMLDRALLSVVGEEAALLAPARRIRLAVLGSATTAHLAGAIRVAGLRRNCAIRIFEAAYGQYRQAVTGPDPALLQFAPDAVLFVLDAQHLAGELEPRAGAQQAADTLEATAAGIAALWERARQVCSATILQQTVLPVLPEVMGSNEHRLSDSRAGFVGRLNGRLRELAGAAGVHLVDLERRAAQDGVRAWFDPALWHRGKQEVTPAAAPPYGEMVARVLGAVAGLSHKCLVLDLDNTLWGGVVGDDGADALVLGQGSALGEAFAEFQRHVGRLSYRGVILAVCSKNDEAVAADAFRRHPEMVLRPSQIAAFVANWNDKAQNLRAIAERLAIGLDALVFVDDNPFERAQVRRELPMVAVPELPEDPALYARCLSDAGYFEAVRATEEDRQRTGQYQAQRVRSDLAASASDMDSYLRSLQMRLSWRRFDAAGMARAVQLINKTNQFNLTTRRYTDADYLAVMADPDGVGLQLRLRDRLGDSGTVVIVVGRRVGEALRIDLWLMSCRVLGRQVEQATLSIVMAEARRLGAVRLIGEYVPTERNAMVRDHYPRLGFAPDAVADRYVLPLAGTRPPATFISIEGPPDDAGRHLLRADADPA